MVYLNVQSKTGNVYQEVIKSSSLVHHGKTQMLSFKVTLLDFKKINGMEQKCMSGDLKSSQACFAMFYVI